MSETVVTVKLGDIPLVMEEWKKRLLDERPRGIFAELGMQCVENIVVGGKYAPGTPIDTGYARATWAVGLNEEPQSPVDTILPGAQSSQARYQQTAMSVIAGLVRELRLGDVIKIISHCVYMPSLEYGHSQQAPAGMIRLTAASLQQILDDAILAVKARGY